MVGIYKYSCGLKFTGIVANTKEEAEAYLGNKYGYWGKQFVGRDENGYCVYEDTFIPSYNKEAFKIQELTVI